MMENKNQNGNISFKMLSGKSIVHTSGQVDVLYIVEFLSVIYRLKDLKTVNIDLDLLSGLFLDFFKFTSSKIT